ncbi:MAG: hypothetical protein Q9217_004391 [Psora testacea]
MPAPTSALNTPSNHLALAADNPTTLLPLLRSNPSLATSQDDHGYSLLHAAASYNHIDLMKCLKVEFNIDPNIVDEDGETALFAVETVETAQCLIEQIGTEPRVKNAEGVTAEEKIRGEGDFVAVADYLKEERVRGTGDSRDALSAGQDGVDNGDYVSQHPPPLPPGVQLHVGSLEDEQSIGEVADQELKRRIEKLASREDFYGEEGQKQLRDLITDALRGVGEDGRDIRRRIE